MHTARQQADSGERSLTLRTPHEADTDNEQLEHDLLVYVAHPEAGEGRHRQRKHTVPQDTHGLKEGDGPAKKLRVKRDCRRAGPHNHEYSCKDQ